jgi:hypothetical protein
VVATSCLELLASNRSLTDGVYTLDLDGGGPSSAHPYYCDMTNGGWTLVANQVPDTLLPNDSTTVNAAGSGSVIQSFRLGVPDITMIRPSLAWKLTDPNDTVYFKPNCVVDWTINYDMGAASQPNVCTTGYTDTSFTTVENGAWQNASVRGIGINNSGASCSIRMFESHMTTAGAIENGSAEAGIAAPCVYQNFTSQRVSLWFR